MERCHEYHMRNSHIAITNPVQSITQVEKKPINIIREIVK